MTAQNIILIVDDQPAGRAALEDLLYLPEYQFEFAEDGQTALQKAFEIAPDLILLDVMMPGMNGFEVCQKMRALPLLAEVPILMLTALDDNSSRLQGIEAGADDFIVKPYNRAELRARVRTILRLNRYRKLVEERSKLDQAHRDLLAAYEDTIVGWSRAMDLRDEETEGHSQRVTEMTLALARAVGMEGDQLVHVQRGALLHDIGKLGIPDAILLKEEKLSDSEWEIMRKHPSLAYEMLFPISYLHPALDIPWCHHEKWDGSGYPQGLKGEEIPLAARLFAVVDVWDALTSDRPYRLAWSEARALQYLRDQAGTHFQPEIVDAFFRLICSD